MCAGAQFTALHLLFNGIADEAEGWSDLLAEPTWRSVAADGTVQVDARRSPTSILIR